MSVVETGFSRYEPQRGAILVKRLMPPRWGFIVSENVVNYRYAAPPGLPRNAGYFINTKL